MNRVTGGETVLTITSEDRRSYQSRVSRFARQTEEDTCFTRAIQNILVDLARCHDTPAVEISHDDAKKACDYRPRFGASSDPLPESLDEHLDPHGYTARIETDVDHSKLGEVIESGTKSLPVVELSESYLHHVDQYDVRAGMHGNSMPHTVVVFTINHDEVQFFDPYEDFYTPPENGGAPPSQIPKSNFFQWWTEGTRRWTMWIEEQPQRTLEQPTDTSVEGR